MVRFLGERFWQKSRWMDQSDWYCVVKPSSTTLVQSASSMSAGPRGLRSRLKLERRPEDGAGADDGDVIGVFGGDERAMALAEFAFPADADERIIRDVRAADQVAPAPPAARSCWHPARCCR